jgi:outer membrane lipoprotein carrier protein
MHRTLRLLFIMVFCLAGSRSWAASGAGADLKTVIATLEGGYALLADLQADFSQRTTISSLKREEKGGGEVFLRRPAGGSAMFRFDYRKPRQQIVSNGKTVWYYLPENRQVMVSDVAAMFSGGNSVALSYLTGMGHVSRDFSVSFSGDGRDGKGNYVLELVPKAANQMLAKLQLTISAAAVERFQAAGKAEEPFPILSSVVVDNLGNRTLIEYSHAKTNRGLGAGRFTFKVPAGVEIIKNR